MEWALFGFIFLVGYVAFRVGFTLRGEGNSRKEKAEIDGHRKAAEERISQSQVAADQALSRAKKKLELEEQRISEARRALDADRRQVRELRAAFEKDFITGRQWVASMIGDLTTSHAQLEENLLRIKTRPAIKSADVVAQLRKDLKESVKREAFLKYELATIKEYFPFVETFEEDILNDEIEPIKASIDLSYDKTRDFISAEEYKKLSEAQRSQLALDRYKRRQKTKAEAGRFYERYLGYLYEEKGFEVEYFGITQGLEDLGRDLICKLLGVTIIVQAKRWSESKTIREKHIYQLFGTMTTYSIEHPGERVEGHLYTTTSLSEVAREAAKRLGIEVHEGFKLDLNYPMIKCNISREGQKIYHLPFDQQYDKTKVLDRGERYVATTAEAEALGFTRAKRHLFR